MRSTPFTSHGIPQADLEEICVVFSKIPQIDRVLLYGSRAMGTHSPGSDIDLTVEGNGLGAEHLFRLRNDLEECNTPYMLDVCLRSAVQQQDLLDHIQRVGQVLYVRKSMSEET